MLLLSRPGRDQEALTMESAESGRISPCSAVATALTWHRLCKRVKMHYTVKLSSSVTPASISSPERPHVASGYPVGTADTGHGFPPPQKVVLTHAGPRPPSQKFLPSLLQENLLPHPQLSRPQAQVPTSTTPSTPPQGPAWDSPQPLGDILLPKAHKS